MRKALPWVLGAWLLAAAPTFAQVPPSPGLPGPFTYPDLKAPPPALAPKTEAPAIPGDEPAPSDTFKFWVRGEYLGWWVKNTPLPVSLVTGDPNNPTQELLNSDRSFGMFGSPVTR